MFASVDGISTTIRGNGWRRNRFSANGGEVSASGDGAGQRRDGGAGIKKTHVVAGVSFFFRSGCQERPPLQTFCSKSTMPQPSWRRISSGVGGGFTSCDRRSMYARTRYLDG